MILICDPTGLWAGIHLKRKLCTHVGEGPRLDQVWKKNTDNWLKINKDPEKLSYIIDLNASLRHFSLGKDGCASLPCFCLD